MKVGLLPLETLLNLLLLRLSTPRYPLEATFPVVGILLEKYFEFVFVERKAVEV